MAETKLISTVALTPEGGKNGNHLRPASLGITEFKLQVPGGPSSQSHLPPPAPTPTGADDFHFAPTLEKVEIAYTLDNSFGAVTRAKLELFTRFKKDPLWTQTLESKDLAHGAHTLPWDGKVTKSKDFPDEYVTVEHSPYKLRLTLEGQGLSASLMAWTYFHVLAADMELCLGNHQVLKHSRDRKLHTDLGGSLPAPGGTQLKLPLISNLFKTASAQMYDNSGFTRYKDAWENGPQVPIFAKVWIRNSSDQKVEAPKALGNVRFLWDWEDEAEALGHHHAKAKIFLENALDYYKATTEPKGDNCHKAHGGKRGSSSAALFPPQPGYAPSATLQNGVFPFKVEACGRRKWAAYSYAWREGLLAGHTGVLLQPSRMAGDAVRVTVHLAFDRKEDGSLLLDTKDAPPLPAAVTKATGTFEVWREVHLARYWKKRATIADISVATVQGYYDKAFLSIKDTSGGSAAMAEANYNTRITTAVAAQPWIARKAINPATNQYQAGDYALHFRDYADFLNAVKLDKGWNAAALAVWLASAGGIVSTAAKYQALSKQWAKAILTSFADEVLSPTPGITLLHFSGLSNLVSSLNGFAPACPSAGPNRCAFILCGGAANYAGNNRPEQTTAHEVGHHLFLPHAPFGVPADGGSDASVHDKDWANCMMGYDFSAERKFCGFCLLRLRGWDKTLLKKDAALNKKP